MSQQPELTVDKQKINNLREEHLHTDFDAHSADEAITTMVEKPLVNQVTVMIGGDGKEELYEFYAEYFLPQIPPDTEMVPVSVVGAEGARSVQDRSIPLNEPIRRGKMTARKTPAAPAKPRTI